MCGVLGAVNLPVDESVLDLIAHRGPDGQGLITRECGAHQITLGHRRLAIVDLSDQGSQPMSTGDGVRHIIFNGEIYNHQDIRRNLESTSFRGHSDTETLLHALATIGIRAVEQLNGIFAFAYLDLVEQRLFLVRDPFGVKPLYYSFSPKRLCFSSELKPLLSLAPDTVDSENLATLLKLRFSPSPVTLFKNIKKVRPGHILEIGLGGESLTCREYPFIGQVFGPASPAMGFGDALVEYRRLFESAVERQLMSDVEVGVLLSGGVDSALVAANAQRYSAAPLKAFTVGFKDAGTGSDVDEIDDARETADFLGMEHHTARIGFDDFLDTLSNCVRIVEEPLATTSIVPMHYLSRLAGSHVKVVMSGQGADEPLGGYGRYQGELYRRFLSPPLARIGKSFAAIIGIRNERILRGLAALSQGNDVARFLEAYSVFPDEEVERMTGVTTGGPHRALEYFYRLLGCDDLPSSVARMMAVDLRFGLSDDLLLYTDKITMHQSLECRVPMLDLELVAFIESLPYEYRVRLGRTKIIHKRLAELSLPASIVHRKKKGFLSPTSTWFRDGDRLRSILLNTDSNFSGYFDLAAVEQIIRQHQLGYNRERHIFLLLCLHCWFAEFT